jgi:N-carbamoylputrescine amidase
MKVSALQLKNYIEEKETSYAAAENLIYEAVTQGSELVALPELSACGYIPNDDVWQYGEKENSITAQWAVKMAKKYAVYIGAGYLETDGEDYYNAYLIATPDGQIAGRVHKIKTEPHCFKSSDIGSVIETSIGKIAIGICADNHVVQFYNRLASLDFDLLLMPHAWATPFAANKYLKLKDIQDAEQNVVKLGAIYAGGFGVPVIFINAVGETPPMHGIFGKLMSPDIFRLRGNSAVFFPDGTAIRSNTEDEEIVTAEVKLGRTRETPLHPFIYNGWLHPGSSFCRKVIAPIDTVLGKHYYEKHHK